MQVIFALHVFSFTFREAKYIVPKAYRAPSADGATHRICIMSHSLSICTNKIISRRGRRPRRPEPNETIALYLIKKIVLYILDFKHINNSVQLGRSRTPSLTVFNIIITSILDHISTFVQSGTSRAPSPTADNLIKII